MKNTLLIVLMTVSTVVVSAQERVYIGGILLDHLSGKPVQAAHVLNLTDSLATISSPEGAFKIPAKLGDSIIFTSIGFHQKALIVTNEELLADFVTVKMARRDYELGEVEVNPLGTKEQFRKKFMELEVDDGTIDVVGLKKPSKLPREIPITEDKNEIKKAKYILNPASFLYGNFSKDAKARQELHRLEKQKERNRYNYQKFNEEVVERTTGYTGERLYDFMEFCNFSETQIYRFTDYELTVAILNKQRSFERLDQQSSKP